MIKKYDFIVIGIGFVGLIIVVKCNKVGWNVVMVDDRLFGGMCVLCGCDLKKVLYGVVEFIDWNKWMVKNGVLFEVFINWKDFMNFKRIFIDDVLEKKEEVLNK